MKKQSQRWILASAVFIILALVGLRFLPNGGGGGGGDVTGLSPTQGPQGTTVSITVVGLSPYTGKYLGVQLMKNGMGFALTFTPTQISGDKVSLTAKIPFGTAYAPGVYSVVYNVYNNPDLSGFYTSGQVGEFQVT